MGRYVSPDRAPGPPHTVLSTILWVRLFAGFLSHTLALEQVSEEEIKEVVAEVIKGEEATLKERRYFFPVGKLLGEVKKRLKFADGATVKRETEAQVEALLGPKTEADLQKPAPVKKVKVSPRTR